MKIHAIKIDEKLGSAYIYITPSKAGASARQVNIADAIIFDIGKNGSVIGVEILHPKITEMHSSREVGYFPPIGCPEE